MADSIRDALTKAVAASEEVVTETQVVPTGTIEDTTPVLESKAGADDTSNTPDSNATPHDDKTAATAASTSSSQQEAAPSSGTQQASQSSATQATATDVVQPPSSWNAKEKAAWAAIPPDARAAIHRRETEMRRAMSATGEARSFKESWDKEMHKYQPLMESKGVTNVMAQVVQPMMQLRAGLEVGSPQQKAGIIGVLCRDFGISIEVLDQVLTHMQQTGGMTPPPPPQKVDYKQVPELAPLFQLQERLAQAQEEKARKTISEVEALPNFETVRNTMADIISAGAADGKSVSILEAYDRASAFHGLEPRVKPEISVSDAAARLAKARNAASSVSGSPRTSPGKKPGSLREQLEAAWSGS